MTLIRIDPKAVLTPEQIETAITGAIQQRLDDFARTRGYDDMRSLATYEGDADPTFNAEGAYGKAARSATWAAARQILAEVKAGVRLAPTSYAEIEALLPPLVWPV
jgi:hypothetical protein